ncbi:MAG TPA: LptF/LptG family permease [Candidatus Hydrogenedentes bacterium]|nr:LptF/LptG family permease [Candidatus Hydrogenedentota bacterium]HPG68621.1 LptF/LptG family permease [Candidatus Hydrogenedentota bacterium]
MTLLDRYFAKRLAATLFKAVLALVLLFILIDLLTHRRVGIVRHEVPWRVVVEYYAVFIPELLYKYQVAALAMLVAALLVWGDAAQNNEVTAALSGGVSLWRLTRAPVAIALALAFGVFALQESVGVVATRRAEAIEAQFFSQTRHETRRPLSWPQLDDGWTCHILKFNDLALTGEQPFLLAIRETEVEQIQAKRIFWAPDSEQWILEDGYWLVFDVARNWELKESRWIRQAPAPFSQTPDELFALDRPPDTKSFIQLAQDIDHAEARGFPVERPRVDLQAKLAQPTLAFVMIWLAIPFAMRIRRGGLAIGFGVSIAIALSYLILFRMGMGLGYIGRVSPMVAAWFANALFLGVGFLLSWRTPT